MSDSEVVGFVQSLRPNSLHSVSSNAYASVSALTYMSTSNGHAPGAGLGAAAGAGAGAGAGAPSGLTGRQSMSLARGAKGAAHQGKILIYQQLVEGLKAVRGPGAAQQGGLRCDCLEWKWRCGGSGYCVG